jgi:DNA-binding PadR family transcriptional regulator
MNEKKNQIPWKKIFLLLLLNKEYPQCKMKEATGMTDPTIIKHLKELEKQKLISCIREDKSSKGGKEKKIFALTNNGLLNSLLLKEVRSNRETIKQIAKAHSDKMRIFEKLPVFEKAKLDTVVIDTLMSDLLTLKQTLLLTPEALNPVFSSIEALDMLVMEDIFKQALMKSQQSAQLKKLFKEDTFLKEYVNAYFTDNKEALAKRIALIEQQEKTWLTD